MKQSKSKLVKVEAQTLRIHPTAQRDLVPSKLKRLMSNLDLDAIGVLHAVEYEIEGVRGIWIIDGQHRWHVLMDHGLGEWIVEVKIHVDVTTDARASELFLRLNDRSPVSPFDKFANAQKAGHTNAVGVVGALVKNGLKLGKASGDGLVSCVSALTKTYDIDKGVTLEAVLETVISAWGRTASATEGKIIEGLALVYATYNGQVDRPALVKKLSKHHGGAPGLIGDAKGLRQFRTASIPRCIAERVIEIYNSGRKVGRLDPL